MRRVFSGSVLPAEVARALAWCAAPLPDAAALDGDGVTVGNRRPGLTRLIGAGSGGSRGSEGGGGRPLPSPGGGGTAWARAAITATSPFALNGLALLAPAVAVSVRFLPVPAIFQTEIRPGAHRPDSWAACRACSGSPRRSGRPRSWARSSA